MPAVEETEQGAAKQPDRSTHQSGRYTYPNRQDALAKRKVILLSHFADRVLGASKRPLNPRDCPLALAILFVKMDVMNASATYRVGWQLDKAGFKGVRRPVMAGGNPLGNSFWGGASDGRD